jgi:hypothetical protein
LTMSVPLNNSHSFVLVFSKSRNRHKQNIIWKFWAPWQNFWTHWICQAMFAVDVTSLNN